jgi:CHAT domain-containing protein
MKTARWIHLATHGLLEADNVYEQAYLSAVALAPSESDDGFLTVRETMKLDLGADLVVLSACDTGRGKITGAGVIGLSRGYLLAGSPTVVASLWPVSDRATVFVMKNFYESLKRGRTKVIALREAMLETRKQFPNAREWAPFSMYGLGN